VCVCVCVCGQQAVGRGQLFFFVIIRWFVQSVQMAQKSVDATGNMSDMYCHVTHCVL